jgi:hypothetical protein
MAVHASVESEHALCPTMARTGASPLVLAAMHAAPREEAHVALDARELVVLEVQRHAALRA